MNDWPTFYLFFAVVSELCLSFNEKGRKGKTDAFSVSLVFEENSPCQRVDLCLHLVGKGRIVKGVRQNQVA